MLEALSRDEVAARACVEPQQVEEHVGAGSLVPGPRGTFTVGDARRIVMIVGILTSGLPLPAIGAAER